MSTVVSTVFAASRAQWAERLLLAGLVVASAGICTSVPLMYVGMALCLAGTLLTGMAALAFCAGWQWAVALSLWMCLSAWCSPYLVRHDPPGFVFCWLALPAFALAVARHGDRRAVRLALLAGGAVALLLAIVQFSVGFDQDRVPLRIGPAGRRFIVSSGFYSHWIRFGDAMAIWAVWMMALSPRPWMTWGAAFLGVLGVFVSGARGAVLALAVGMWGALSTSWRRSLVAALAGVLLVVGVGFVLQFTAPQRMEKLLNGQDGRTYIWATSWQVFKQHPVMGIGNGAYNQAATAVVEAGLAPRNPSGEGPDMGNAHNSYLSLLVLYGVPGLVLWGGWLVAVVRAILRHRQRHPAIMPVLMATLGVVLVGGLTEDLAAYASSRFQLFFGLALALGMALRQSTEPQLSEPQPSLDGH